MKNTRKLLTIICSLIILLVLMSRFISIGVVVSDSMAPSQVTGDIIIGALCNDNTSFNRGDCIEFKRKADNNAVIGKRIIGLPNETVEIAEGCILINGKPIEEDYLDYYSPLFTFSNYKKFVVPEGHYFLLGDNRMYSSDSREWIFPYVNKSDIVSKDLFVIRLSNFNDGVLPYTFEKIKFLWNCIIDRDTFENPLPDGFFEEVKHIAKR